VHLWTVLGAASYCIGDFTAALEYETRAAKLDDDVQCTHQNPLGGGDPAVVCRSYAGVSCTALGLIEESVAWSEEAWAIANARGHAFSIAWAGLVRMRSLNPLGHFAESVDIGNVCAGICERHGFNARLGNVLVFRGAARLAIGEREEGLSDMRRGIAIWRQTSGTFHVTQLISELVQCLLRLERIGEAEQALQEAEEIVGKTEEQSHCSEIQRLRGHLHEVADERERATICYQKALEWSRARQAKQFELRASTSLARLWCDHGKRTEARDLLGPIYNWFTEGFDASDLRDARALLDELS
jgi:tetratricopeptide (TPR) repeat protein